MKLHTLFFSLTLFCGLMSFSTNTEAKNSINVLTYNVWMIPLQRKMAKARAEAIGKTIGQFDLVFLQEAFTAGIRKTVATHARKSNKIENRYQTRLAHKLSSGKFTLGKFEITKSSFKRFKNCKGIQCMSGKGVLYVQIKLPSGVLIDTFNTHLQAYEKFSLTRKWQMLEALALIDTVNDGEIPVLFVGDFNVIGETIEYTQFKDMLFDFEDVWRITNPNKDGFTWNPDANPWAKYDYNESQLLQRLDYIFVRDGKHKKWKIESSKLEYTKKKKWFGVFKKAKMVFGSDHFGLSARLSLIDM